MVLKDNVVKVFFCGLIVLVACNLILGYVDGLFGFVGLFYIINCNNG